MYLPYLRGKQFELIALREFAVQSEGNNQIIPIIEPVKDTFNGLAMAVKIMAENGMKFALVLNPSDGDFRRRGAKDIMEALPQLSAGSIKEWIPAFIVNNNFSEIDEKIKFYKLTEVMLVYKGGIDVEDTKNKALLGQDCVRYIAYDERNSSRAVKRRLDSLNKSLIRFDDKFINQKKNADYLNNIDELYTEEHRYYMSDGFWGFADYTTLSKDFIDGGMLPYAVAIHLTYAKTPDEIWVHHFVSDTNDDNKNVHKKFFEAACKVSPFFIDRPRTRSIDELLSMVNGGKYPGLGVIKKLSIKNHIELMNRLLVG